MYTGCISIVIYPGVKRKTSILTPRVYGVLASKRDGCIIFCWIDYLT